MANRPHPNRPEPGPSGALPVPAAEPPRRDLAELRQQALTVALTGAEPAPASDEIDLLDYWRIIVKRRWTVLSILFICLVVTLVATLLSTPIYRATTTLQIERDTMKVVNVEGLLPSESPADKDFYQTQYELLTSRALLQRVIDELRLADNPAFQRLQAPSPWGKLLGAIFSGGSAEPPSENALQASRIGALFRRLSVEPVRNSRLVRVNFDSPDPAFSALVANEVANSFIKMNLDRRLDASTYAKTYLEDRLSQLKQRLQDSEQQLVDFAQKESIVQIDDKQTLVSQQLTQISAALADAQNERIKVEARYRQVQAAKGTALPEVLASEVIQTLKEKRAQISADYQDKLSVYKPGYPAMQRLREQMAELDRQIASEVANIKGSVAAEYQAAKAKEDLLNQRLTDIKNDTLDLQNRSIQYNILKREVDTNRELYDGLLQRYKEIGVAGGVGTNNISVIDRAPVPTGKFKPRLPLNLAVAGLFGLFCGVLLAFLFEHLDDTLKTPEDVERQFGLAVLGVIPRIKKSSPLAELEDQRSAFAEAYRSVRTALQFSTDKGVPRTLFVTSCSPGEGKSTTALTLAQNFAQLGKRVLLIDADLRNPSLHRLLDLKNSTGLSNYLAGASRPLSALQATRFKKLACLTTGPLPPNPAELLAGAKMLTLLSFVAEKFDQVIIDGPPLLGIADAAILSNMSAGTVVVVESASTRQAYARNGLKRLVGARARLLGVILTKFDAKTAGYGYGYGYGYGDYGYYAYGAEPSKRLARA